MYKKLIGLVSLVGLMGAGSLVACSSESGGGTTTTKDAGTDSGVKKDSGTTPADSGTSTDAPACYDAAAAGAYDQAKVVVAKQAGACTAQDIKDFQAACLGTAADQTKCDAFTKAKGTCSGCLFTGANKDASGKNILPALVPFGDTSVIPNTEACAAITLKNEATCGLAYVNETTCIISTCSTCEGADLNKCANASADDACTAALVDPNGACGKAYTAGQAQVDSACSGTAFDDTFAKVAAVLCQ